MSIISANIFKTIRLLEVSRIHPGEEGDVDAGDSDNDDESDSEIDSRRLINDSFRPPSFLTDILLSCNEVAG